MSEAYCSFEVARLLKEKGFAKFIPFGWNLTERYPDLRNFIEDTGRGGYYDKKGDWLSCPTHQMAMAWLREKNIIIVPTPTYFNADGVCSYWECDIWAGDNYEKYREESSTYEEAVEKALKYSLKNLIK